MKAAVLPMAAKYGVKSIFLATDDEATLSELQHWPQFQWLYVKQQERGNVKKVPPFGRGGGRERGGGKPRFSFFFFCATSHPFAPFAGLRTACRHRLPPPPAASLSRAHRYSFFFRLFFNT